jgi:hypothetical protein
MWRRITASWPFNAAFWALRHIIADATLRTRLFPEVTRIMPLAVSKGE